MTWVLYSLLANACIMWVEYANRHLAGDTFMTALKFTLLPIIVAQFGLYKAFNGAPHLLAAWLVFSIGNTAMRLGMVHFLTREGFAWWGTLGAAGMIASAWVVKEALHYGTTSG